MHYQTTAGERIFHDSHTTDRLLHTHFGIPLYSSNCTYTVRITAVTEDEKTITSNDYPLSIPENYTGQGSHGYNLWLGIIIKPVYKLLMSFMYA